MINKMVLKNIMNKKNIIMKRNDHYVNKLIIKKKKSLVKHFCNLLRTMTFPSHLHLEDKNSKIDQQNQWEKRAIKL